jgi:replicative DNA helicase
MAKKGNLNLEFCILKTLMNKSTDPETKSILLSSLTQNSFAFDESKDVYDLIFKEFTDASKPIPSLSVILNHPEISERSKIFLKKEKYQPFDDKEDVVNALSSLKEYSNRRKLAEVLEKGYELLNKGVSASKIVAEMDSSIFEIKSGNKSKSDFVVGGVKGDNSSKRQLKEILSRDKTTLSRTGFKQLDKLLGGGAEPGNVITISASTGGGKSTAALDMMKFVYSVNHENVLLASLEMKNKELSERLYSCLTRIPYAKIKNKTFTDEEALIIKKAWKKFERIGRENDCRYCLWSPVEDVNIHQLLAPCTNMGYKWVFIDYLNLVAEDKENLSEPQSLSKMTRYAKRWAQANNCIVVILTQLDEKTHDIRYSRAIKEHSNIWLWWHYTEEDRESGCCDWNLAKSRSSELGKFTMDMMLKYMTIKDKEVSDKPNSTDRAVEEDRGKKKKRKIKEDSEDSMNMLDDGDDF